MAIRLICPGCKAPLSLADEAAGKTVRCKRCQTVCRVPGDAPNKPAAAVPPLLMERQQEVADRPAANTKTPAPRSKASLSIGVAASGCLLLGVAVGGVGAWFLSSHFFRKDTSTPSGPVAVVSSNTTADIPKGNPTNNTPQHDPGQVQPIVPADTPAPIRKRKTNNPPRKQPPPIPGPVEPLGGRDSRPADKTPLTQTPPSNDTPPSPGGAKKVVRTLPGTVTQAAVGGGGRYLILHLARERKLAIFDTKEARIARYVTLTADNVKFTAGQDKIVVVLPDTNVIQRWDIASGERELSISLAVKGAVQSVCMGSASAGPVFVAATKDFRHDLQFLDLRSLKSLNVKTPERFRPGDWINVRASADGKTFTSWRSSGSPQGITILGLTGSEARSSYQHDSVGHVLPGPDGKVLYTARGLWTAEAKPKDPRDRSYCLPAARGDLYLRLELSDRPDQSDRPPRVSVCMPGDQPLVTLTDLDVPTGITRWDKEPFGSDQRICFLPYDGLLITIPISGDRLVLHRFDLISALENSGTDYLLVTSRPLTQASQGSTYSYQIVTRSKKGGVKYRLDSGPKGMDVSASGLVKWTVSPDAKTENEVILNITDASGQEVFHSFTIGVRFR